MQINEEKALQTAWNAARAAGTGILLARQRGLAISWKKDKTQVTQGDKEAEKTIRKLLSRDFPKIPVVGEEQGGSFPKRGWAWVVDPIDATKNYIRGLPLFGVLIALVRDLEPRAGVVFMPATGEGWKARRGEGAFNHRGEKLAVSKRDKVSESLLCHGEVDYILRSPYKRGFEKLATAVQAVRGYGDFYGHMLVASGQAEAMLDPVVKPWDVAPIQVIVEEAGGSYSDVRGKPGFLGDSALSTNGKVHGRILRALKA